MLFSEKDIKKIWEHDFFKKVDRTSALTVFTEYGCSIESFEEGETILSPDSERRTVGLILAGSATVKTKDPTKNALLRFLREGDIFGVANLFTEDPFVSNICADKKCRVFLLPKEAVRALLLCDRAFLDRYLSFLCGRVCYLNKKIGYLTAGSAERRLALYLSSFESDEIVLDASLSSLSELLDVGRASLYRAFDRLSLDGYIRKDGRHITVLSKEAMLRAYQ